MQITRRKFLGLSGSVATVMGTGIGLSGILASRQAPAAITQKELLVPYGVQAGDILQNQAMIWSRAERDAMMTLEWSTRDDFKTLLGQQRVAALEDTDFTAKVDITDLPTGEKIFYRVQFSDLADRKIVSQPVVGSLTMPSASKRNVRFLWSGDTVGQGWGINPDLGGMTIYQEMAKLQPDFFIHSGDNIYADGPIASEVKLEDGTIWRNLVTEEKSKVAETLREFRGNYAYNLMDEHVRNFNANVPLFSQWDDHETVNNWYPGEILTDERYKQVQSVDLLAARGARAFMEYMPVRPHPLERNRLYQQFSWGPQLDIFRLDMRSYRGPNSENRQEKASEDTEFLGSTQIRWLKSALLNSKATWKIIAADMPIGLLVRDGEKNFENLANGDGPALGREIEMANLLRFIRDNQIQNVVWLTADVHYTAAHYYHPDKAQFQDFAPFWEFVSGPLNAGTFGPGVLDNTFGPELMYVKAPEKGQVNLPPSAGLQFFGQVDLDAESGALTVSLKDMVGATLYSKVLTPNQA